MNFPNTDHLDDTRLYLVPGSQWKWAVAAIKSLSRGENVQQQGTSIRIKASDSSYSLDTTTVPGSGKNSPNAWPWKVYDASVGSTAQVRINSGDGRAGQINNIPGTVSGQPITTPVPPAAPGYLAVQNGWSVYIQLTFDVNGNVTAAAGMAAAAVPPPDTVTPPVNEYQLLAQITVVTDPPTGKVTTTVDNSTSTGFSGFQLCAGSPVIW